MLYLHRPRLRTWGIIFSAWSCLFCVANAQFKEVGPAPFPPTVARQQIRALLDKVDSNNRRQTTDKLSSLLVWYRDILDEELIAAWQKDTRVNLPEVIESLADTRVAIAIVNFSWRQERAAAFDLGYAPMFGHLMARFPDSAQPLLDDLIGSGKTPPALSGPEAQALCRILLDMPDIGMWRQNALKILPLYRRAAESLLVQDMHGSDQDKSYQAQRWLLDLKSDVPGIASEQPMPRRRPIRSQAPVPDREPNGDRTVSILRPSPELDRGSLPTSTSSAPAHPPTIAVPVSPSVPPAPDPAASPYTGPQSGTLESNGSPIAQNAECVFRSLPPLKLQLDYDTKTWDARLAPGEGQTQRLILKNKSSGPQKRCVVHWKVVP